MLLNLSILYIIRHINIRIYIEGAKKMETQLTHEEVVNNIGKAIMVVRKFSLKGCTIEFTNKVLEIFEETTEKCLKENRIGYNAGVIFTSGVKTLLDIAKIYNWEKIESLEYIQDKKEEIVDKLLEYYKKG